MGKKSRTLLVKEIEAVRWFQWEFLRRNPAYQRDHEAFMKEFGPWFTKKGLWYDQEVIWDPEALEFFRQRIAPRAAAICQKWQILDPFPPDWSFNQESGHIEYKTGWFVSLPTGDYPDQIAAHWDFLEGKQNDVAKKAPPRESDGCMLHPSNRLDLFRYSQATFDLARPRRELFEQARRVIVFGQERYENILRKEKRRQPKRRRRLSEYAQYLEVWDLRQQGLTFEQIAEQIYSVSYTAHRKMSRRLNPIVQRVQEHYARARQLIEGGYKEIR